MKTPRLLAFFGAVATGTLALAAPQLITFTATNSPVTSTNPNSILPNIPFNLYLPDGYTTSETYPVVVYLHGKGGSYNGNSNQSALRSNYEAARTASVIGPVIIIIPDGYGKTFPGYSATVETGWSDSHPSAALTIPCETDVWQVIDYVDTNYSTKGDLARAIIGHSMGGSGSAKFAAKYPEKFVAWVGYDAPLNTWGSVDADHYVTESYFDEAGNPWYWIDPATPSANSAGTNVAKIIAMATRFRQVEASAVGGDNPDFRAILISDGITSFPAVGSGGTPNEEYNYVGVPHSPVSGIFTADGTASWAFLGEVFDDATLLDEEIPALTEDGWILESAQGSGVGGSTDPNSNNLIVGDNATRQGYRSVLSFDTAAYLPANAIIESATLRLTRTVGAGSALGTLRGYVKSGHFGSATTLENGDWQQSVAQGIDSISIPAANNSTTADLNATGLAAINLNPATDSGRTQIRLAFDTVTDGDSATDTRGFASANHGTSGYRPVLTVFYRLP